MALSGLGPTVLWVLWTETIIALIFVCLRLYTRATMVRKIGLDDHLAWISMVRSLEPSYVVGESSDTK